MFAIALAMSVLAGCGKATPREELAEIARATDAACACADRTCAISARTHLDEVVASFRKRPKQVDSELTNQMLALLTDAGVCLGKHQ